MTGNKALRNLTRDVTEKLEDTEFLACYSVAVTRRVRKQQRWAKWLVAVAASVPFVAHLRAISGPTADWVVAIVPLLAVALPIWNPERTLEVASTLHGRYHQVLPLLRALWRRLRDFEGPSEATATLVQEISDRFKTLDEQIASIRSGISSLPDIRKLKERCKASVPRYALAETEPHRTAAASDDERPICYKTGN
jgi:hypothetical protein